MVGFPQGLESADNKNRHATYGTVGTEPAIKNQKKSERCTAKLMFCDWVLIQWLVFRLLDEGKRGIGMTQMSQEDFRGRAMDYPFATERLSPSAFIDAGHGVREDVMDYNSLVRGILTLHLESVQRAALAVNQALVLRSWTIGAYLVEFERNGSDRAAYGVRLMERVAKDLKAQNIRGLGVSMLKNCRQFYRLYPQIGRALPAVSSDIQLPRICQSVIGEFDAIAWGRRAHDAW